MCDGCMDWIDRVAEEIEAHVSTRPEASDTAAGIAEWWIGQRRFLEAEENVEAALVRLVDRGALERLSLPGAPDRFRAARAPLPLPPAAGGARG